MCQFRSKKIKKSWKAVLSFLLIKDQYACILTIPPLCGGQVWIQKECENWLEIGRSAKILKVARLTLVTSHRAMILQGFIDYGHLKGSFTLCNFFLLNFFGAGWRGDFVAPSLFLLIVVNGVKKTTEHVTRVEITKLRDFSHFRPSSCLLELKISPHSKCAARWKQARQFFNCKLGAFEMHSVRKLC